MPQIPCHFCGIFILIAIAVDRLTKIYLLLRVG